MKVAIQLFGHLRTFAQCADSLRLHLLDRYPDHDVFIHTWDRLEHDTVTHHGFRCDARPVDEQIIAAVHESYRPRRMAIGHQVLRDLGELSFANGKRMAISGIAYMFESLHHANHLREAYAAETGVEYDVVVAVRPDLCLRRPLELETFLAHSRPPALPDDETRYTRFAAFGPVPLVLNDLRGLPATDLLFFARPEVMTRIVSLHEQLARYDLSAVVAPARSRNLMNTYCADIGIQTAIIDYIRPRDFDIARP